MSKDNLIEQSIDAEQHPTAKPSKHHGVALSDRVLHFDCDVRIWHVTRQQEMEQARADGKQMEKLFVPRSPKEVALFTDRDTRTAVSTDNDYQGCSTLLLSKIYLDGLGPMDKFSRMFGGLQTIYVSNVDSLAQW